MKPFPFPIFFKQSTLEQSLDANHGSVYRQCSKSLLDTIADPLISFDKDGISHYYHTYKQAEKQLVFTGVTGQQKLDDLLENIKQAGKRKKYDCLIGISGGVDSTYLSLQAVKWGLRPLLVHCDNGWNDEKAIQNLNNTVKTLQLDIHIQKIEAEAFRLLQRAYLFASVVDIEVLTDHALLAVLYQTAAQLRIPYILSGMNIATEQVLPQHWIFNKEDTVNIKNIFKQFGEAAPSSLRGFPMLSYSKRRFYTDILKIKVVSPLNFTVYRYDHVKEIIKDELGWQDYGNKHFESIWTRFFQSVILPHKFLIDKRKAHLSNLIFSGQLSKEKAQELIQQPLCDPDMLQEDYNMVLKKLELSEATFKKIIQTPRREHFHFGVQKGWREKLGYISRERSDSLTKNPKHHEI